MNIKKTSTGLIILGSQLFDPKWLPPHLSTSTVIFMREDFKLCTHFKYHKHKIIFFLSAMRKHARQLRSMGYRVIYHYLGDDTNSFEASLKKFIQVNNVSHLYCFEIEDKFFEQQLQHFFIGEKNLQVTMLPSPMFLTTRNQFMKYLSGHKTPFMKTFYEQQRKRLQILIDEQGKPVGGRWSFDEDNRQRLPKDQCPPALPSTTIDDIDREVMKLVDHYFADHPGQCDNYWLPTERSQALNWLEHFLHYRLTHFGDYEDALSSHSPFVYHSVLTPFLNTGLLTPGEIITATLNYHRQQAVPLNSLEGFIRQIIGWREFIRGIYQNFSEQQEKCNFWNHHRHLSEHWYRGDTGIPPLDEVINKVQRYAYAHHIERLMVVGSLMVLLEIDPREAYRWFMEMFIDSSDWVMVPNVYGMALFSDGGIFATKPYICGSNYYRKMGDYPKGDWQLGVDGLYWKFIDRHQEFFTKNPRLAVMVSTLKKMNPEKKSLIFREAEKLQLKLTR